MSLADLQTEIDRLQKILEVIAGGHDIIDTGGQNQDGSWITDYHEFSAIELREIAKAALTERTQT